MTEKARYSEASGGRRPRSPVEARAERRGRLGERGRRPEREMKEGAAAILVAAAGVFEGRKREKS